MISLCSRNGRPRINSIHSPGAMTAKVLWEVQMPSRDITLNSTYWEGHIDLEAEEDITMSTFSGSGRRRTGKPSFATVSGQMRTRWEPLLISEENFNGNSAAGPSIVHFHTICFDLNGGLMETSPSEKLALPIMDKPVRGPKIDTTKSKSPEVTMLGLSQFHKEAIKGKSGETSVVKRNPVSNELVLEGRKNASYFHIIGHTTFGMGKEVVTGLFEFHENFQCQFSSGDNGGVMKSQMFKRHCRGHI